MEKLPWHTEQWKQLEQLFSLDKIPHAMILSGMRGLGQLEFAFCLVQAMLCKSPTNILTPCLKCADCIYIEMNTHPDLCVVQPEKAESAIKVDQIRELTEFVFQSSFKLSHRFVLIQSAESMNIAAQNALLKTLEEPPHSVYIILLTNHHLRLLPTVRSRCFNLPFQAPDKMISLRWLNERLSSKMPDDVIQNALQFAGGAPIEAKIRIENGETAVYTLLNESFHRLILNDASPTQLAEQFKEHYSSQFLDDWIDWHLNWMKWALGCREESLLRGLATKNLFSMTIKISVDQHLSLLRSLQHHRALLSSGQHLNKQLALESLLIEFKKGIQSCN